METKAPQRVEEANAAGLVVGLSTAPSNEEARAVSHLYLDPELRVPYTAPVFSAPHMGHFRHVTFSRE